jgi:hypothetical protein
MALLQQFFKSRQPDNCGFTIRREAAFFLLSIGLAGYLPL